MSFRSAMRRWCAGDGVDSGRFTVTEELTREQRVLANEVERLFRVFDERLETLASRMRELSPDEIEREADMFRTEQDSFRRALRRLEATAKSTRELERELDEWASRNESGAPHADHPSVRREIVASELATRDPRRSQPLPPVDADDAITVYVEEAHERELPSPEIVIVAHEPLPSVDPGYLLSAIREATREAERWHAVPEDTLNEDALTQVNYLRELHVILKRLDRANGVVRDRLDMAVMTSEAD